MKPGNRTILSAVLNPAEKFWKMRVVRVAIPLPLCKRSFLFRGRQRKCQKSGVTQRLMKK
jgi:hypothetical protein